MLYDDDAALKAYNEALDHEEFEVILARTYHALYALGVIYEAVIIRPHVEVKVKCLRTERHIQEWVAVDDFLSEHTLLSHRSHSPLPYSARTRGTRS